MEIIHTPEYSRWFSKLRDPLGSTVTHKIEELFSQRDPHQPVLHNSFGNHVMELRQDITDGERLFLLEVPALRNEKIVFGLHANHVVLVDALENKVALNRSGLAHHVGVFTRFKDSVAGKELAADAETHSSSVPPTRQESEGARLAEKFTARTKGNGHASHERRGSHRIGSYPERRTDEEIPHR